MKNSAIKILLVDDEPDIIEIVGFNLKNEGYQVFSAQNGIEAVQVAKNVLPHLIILDIMMPEMDGIDACEKIRSVPELQNVLITFFTARGEDYSQMAGYNVGADDYITKPIKPKVLASKVRALLRRMTISSPEYYDKTTVGNIIIDREEYLVIKNGIKLALPRKEFELFSLLASKPGKVFKRDDILTKVWGTEVIVGGRTIDVHIRKLREKIGDNYFETVKGVGYKFVINED
jgi:two-component system alkaline phosphatase synthesis response regulator PhoP